MSNNNVAVLIRQEMAKLERQYKGLADALQVINEIGGGKQTAFASLGGLYSSGSNGKSKAKRGPGRPPGTSYLSDAYDSGKRPAKVKPSKRPKRGINLNNAIREYIVNANRFVSSSELADKFASHYPEKTRADFAKYVSVLLSIAKANKKLAATSLDKKGNEQRASYWGLPEWFKDGRGKNDYYK